MANDGKDYEIFVATPQKAILTAEEFTNLRNIVFDRNRKRVNSYGVKRECDIYWEYELGGSTLRPEDRADRKQTMSRMVPSYTRL